MMPSYRLNCWIRDPRITLDQHPAKRVQSLETTVLYLMRASWQSRYNIGVIPSRKSLALCERLSVSSFCQRRLSTVLLRLKYAEHLKEAVTYIQQGHIRVGPETVTDPAFLVMRSMEDFITWVDSSKIKRKVLEYNDKLDDYDAMN
ncbi:hypothetical protein RHSIM_Rhsim08G0077600 [Rhododendron simsii]|uniref:U3 small nucleolar ribonucleoprotein protein IMP3 n=1 Tax=Rhododendron simsii TaxID=118357 RepID=A0A834LHJ7_RHOSS|nr:hypothetical protein RHSIM_Rhsim08G0077600 [Rhododendron simsii]